MKFNFFKKVWGKKKLEEKEKKEDENKKNLSELTHGVDFKILPLLTEKTLKLAKENKYTFLVEPKINKDQIKKAIEKIFNVKVIKVKDLNYKKRTRGKTKIKSTRAKFKKAIVELQLGQTISVFE